MDNIFNLIVLRCLFSKFPPNYMSNLKFNLVGVLQKDAGDSSHSVRFHVNFMLIN